MTSNTSTLAVVAAAYTAPSTSVGTASGIQNVTVALPVGLTLGSIDVVTQGAKNLDFAFATGGTCSIGTAYTANQTCTVNYIFTPIAAGGRMGAVLLKDGQGKVAATTYIGGVGIGPQVVFGIAPTAQIGGGGPNSQFGGFGWAYSIAVDAVGNVFVADAANEKVIMVPPSDQTCQSSCISVGGHIAQPSGIAIDGAGNLYIVDYGNNEVLKVSSADLTCSTPSDCTTVGIGLLRPLRVAVDGIGNVYIADQGNNRILKVPPTDLTCSVPGSCTSVGPALGFPQTVAVDGVGNVFIAPDANGHIVEVPPTDQTCTIPGDCVVINSGNGTGPIDLAVDAAGDIYMAISGVAKVLSSDPTCTNYNDCAYLTPGGNFYSVAVDGAGNLYAGGGPYKGGSPFVTKFVSADPPSLGFLTTSVGSTNRFESTIVSNVGNSPLVLSTPSSGSNPSYPLDFPNDPADANLCAAGAMLAPGGSCDIAVDFTPTTAGLLSESVVLKDNAPNSPQSINVSGTASSSLSVLPATLPNGNFGQAYSAVLSGREACPAHTRFW